MSSALPAAEPGPPRLLALHALLAVLRDGRSLETVLPDGQPGPDPAGAAAAQRSTGAARDAALVSELCYGVLRWLSRLRSIAARLLERPLRERDLDVEIALLMGLYQLEYTRVPPHAAVSTAVELVRQLRKRWAAGLVNGVLRRFVRERDALLAGLGDDLATELAHPPWLVEAIRDSWPDRLEAILRANQARAPMTLRVNRRRVSREDYLGALGRAGLAGAPTRHSPDGLILDRPVPSATLPGFADGLVSVQDEAAQLAATLLAPPPGARVLDACAAPGGKAAHLLESHCRIAELVALDSAPDRLERLRDTFRRLGLDATVVAGDARSPDTWWDGRLFDAILVDAPCTATGVIRRHPDIKAHRQAPDVERSAARQTAILTALWPLLRPAGHLLYATCSVLSGENDAVVAAFLDAHGDAQLSTPEVEWGCATPHGRQVLPGQDRMDGFYFARLVKAGAATATAGAGSGPGSGPRGD